VILSFKLFERGAGIKVKQGGDKRKPAYQCLISFVWLWETSHELAQKKVEFHKIMQTAVPCIRVACKTRGFFTKCNLHV